MRHFNSVVWRLLTAIMFLIVVAANMAFVSELGDTGVLAQQTVDEFEFIFWLSGLLVGLLLYFSFEPFGEAMRETLDDDHGWEAIGHRLAPVILGFIFAARSAMSTVNFAAHLAGEQRTVFVEVGVLITLMIALHGARYEVNRGVRTVINRAGVAG